MSEFFWWIRIILTFGDVIDDHSTATRDQRSVNNVRFNGKIASVQLFLVMIGTSFALSFWRLTTATYGVTKTVFLLIFMLTGIGVLVHFNVNRSKILAARSLRWTGPTEPPKSPPPRDNFTVFGIVVFYFFGCVMDIFHVYLASDCFGVWRTCQNVYYTLNDGLQVCYHVVKIVYFGAQTLFCIVFNKAVVADRSAIRCGLMCLAAINLSLWFECFVNIVFGMILVERPVDSLKFRCYADASNASAKAVQCLQQNTTMHHFLNTYMSPIFVPFTIEIAILIGECLYNLFSHCTAAAAADAAAVFTGDAPERREIPTGRRPRGGHDHRPPPDEMVANKPDDDDDDPYTEPDDNYSTRSDFSVSYDETSSLLTNTGDSDYPSPRSTTLTWQLSYLLAFLTSALALALAILYRVHSESTMFPYYYFPFRALMFAGTVVGFCISKTFRVERGKPFTAIDYILLVSCAGHLQISLFSFLACVGNKLGFFGATKILDILQGYFQAIFVLYTSRIEPRRSAESDWRAAVFQYLIFFLAVSNGTLWLAKTCVGLNLTLDENAYFGQTIESVYYKPLTWSIMYNTLAPLHLMFQLLSCFAFTRTFLRLRSRNRGASMT